MAKVRNGVEKLPKISTSYLGRTSVTDRRQTDGRQHIANYCGQTVGWIKMALGMKVGLGPGYIVLNRDPLPSRKKGADPQFWAHFYCGQRLDASRCYLVHMEVGLSPVDFALDSDPTPSPKKGTV